MVVLLEQEAARTQVIKRYNLQVTAERLTALSVGVGSNVNVNNHWASMRCGSYKFSISEDRGQPLDGCVTDPPPANPHRRGESRADRQPRRVQRPVQR